MLEALNRREETLAKLETTHAAPTGGVDLSGKPEADCLKKRQRRDLLASMDAGLVAKSIIKNEAADKRLHVLAIARRLRYCLDA